MKDTRRKIIFTSVFVILLAVLGALGYVWLKQSNIININKESILTPAPGVPKTYISVTEAEPLVSYQKPADNAVIKFPVFNYHHIRLMPAVASSTITDRAFTVSPEGFEAHLKYFKNNGYQIVLARDLVEYYDTGRPLPEKAVAITFDDGRYGQYKWAFQLLKQYGFKATFFITTDWIGKNDYMAWAQVKEMSDAGMEIGSHALSHPHLSALTDARLKKELADSKKIIEEHTGKTVDLLAYPGGDYNERVIEFAKNSGYTAAFGVYKIINQMPKYRYAIRRFHADDDLESVVNKLVEY